MKEYHIELLLKHIRRMIRYEKIHENDRCARERAEMALEESEATLIGVLETQND